ncbi:MAG: hypothetical protein Q4C70_14755 [Planctomycetia bacterium]|nr:hypothetical protein [Planctomycetia bacterium]
MKTYRFLFLGMLACVFASLFATSRVFGNDSGKVSGNTENANNAVRYRMIRDVDFTGKNELDAVKPNFQGATKTVEDGDSWVCENAEEKGTSAVVWSVPLNQKTPTPILFSGESRLLSETVAPSRDYSLYLDLVYADDTPGWGIIKPFTGKNEWEAVSRQFVPKKPIKRVAFYCLFRGCVGKVAFRNVSLIQADAKMAERITTFDGQCVTAVGNVAEMGTEPESARETVPRFYLRDALANSDWVRMETVKNIDNSRNTENETVFEASLSENKPEFTLSWSAETAGNGATIDRVKIRSNSAAERGVTLVAAIPMTEKMSRAFLGLDGVTEIVTGEVGETYPTKAGMKQMNRFPIQGVGSTLKDDAEGAGNVSQEGAREVWLGIDPAFPAVYRTFFNAETQELCIAYDLGFIPTKKEWELRFCRFTEIPGKTEKDGGMRRAWKRYMETYPAAFLVRVPKMGNWMAFAPTSQVKNPEDFGFAFKEGTDEPAWDDAHGLITFRYTEPMTWWMSWKTPMAEGMDPKKVGGRETTADILKEAAKEARKQAENGAWLAKAWEKSVMYDANQRPVGQFLDTPWCRGVVWSMCGLPGLGEGGEFHVKWTEDYVNSVYPKLVGGEKNISAYGTQNGPCFWTPTENHEGIDGEYIDSSEGYVTTELDFRAEHLACVETPLTFSLEAGKPAVLRGLVTFEYVRKMQRDVHAAGKLMMANSTPIRLSWLAPILDVLGTESNWNWNGNWTPMAIEELQYRRMLCGGKPFCFLQNTNFDLFTYDHSERFMKRCLAFGMFPSYFSADASTKHYFRNPELYERDRPLFKKYMPLCRLVGEAGWEPVTGVSVTDSRLLVERFGDPERDGVYYLTIYNPEKEVIQAKLTDFAPEMVGEMETLIGSANLGPEDVWVVKVSKKVKK